MINTKSTGQDWRKEAPEDRRKYVQEIMQHMAKLYVFDGDSPPTVDSEKVLSGIDRHYSMAMNIDDLVPEVFADVYRVAAWNVGFRER